MASCRSNSRSASNLSDIGSRFLTIHSADLRLQCAEFFFGLANLVFRSSLGGPGLLDFLPGAVSLPWIDLGLCSANHLALLDPRVQRHGEIQMLRR